MKTVLFDLDGTLLDTLQDLTASVNYTLRALSLPERGKDEVRRFVGNGVKNLIRLILGEENQEKAEFALSLYNEHYALHKADHTSPYEGIRELIAALHGEGRKIAVVSNKPHDAVKSLVREHFPEIEFAIGQQEPLRRKPWPDMLLFAMEEMGEERENCLYVGDSDVDIITAENAGIPCISVTWGFRDPDCLREAGGKIFAENARALYRAIRNADQSSL